MRNPLIIFLLLVGLGFSAWAQPYEKTSEEQAREIEGLLMAPCCWRQTVSVHPSPASDEMKKEIRSMLAAGMTKDEIVNKFVAEYGERILAKPPAEGFGSLAYFLPAIFLLLGGATAVTVIKRLRPSQKAGAPRAVKVPPESKYATQLEKELWG